MTAADFCEQAQGLTDAGAVEEGILLGIGQRLAELLDDVAFQIESAVIEQLLGHLDGNVQLVGIQQDLGEGGIGELERTAFLDPCGGRLGGRDIDLVLTGSGDHMAQAAHDVLLRQGLNQAAVILLGHEVAAIGIHAFLQNVADLTEVGAQGGQHSLAVFVRRTPGLDLRLLSGGGLGSEGCIHGLAEFRIQRLLPFQTSDFLAEIGDVLLHAGISGIVLGGQGTLLGTMGIQKCLGGIPCGVALFAQFLNRHNQKSSLMFHQIEPLHEIIHGAFRLGGLLFDAAFRRQLVHQVVGHRRPGKQHRPGDVILCASNFRAGHNLIGKAQVDRRVGVHPGFRIHQVGQLGAAHAGLDLIGVDDGFLHLVQHGDGFLHFCGIAHSHGGGIVDHQHRHRRHQHPGASHGNDRSGRGSDAVNLNGHAASVIHEHIVDLSRSHTVAAGAVDPDRDIAAPGIQFLPEQLGRDIIVKPAFLGDGAVQRENPLLRFRLRWGLIRPVPKLLHFRFPPFPRRYPRPAAWSCFR